MKVLVVYAHPVEDSFAAAMRNEVVMALKARGHEIDLCDLYAEGFDPVLSREERIAHRDVTANRASVAHHIERLKLAEGIIIVFPSWWFGMPAILKGWFDRVWLPGVAFSLEPRGVRPLLTNLRLFGVVTTAGSPWWLTCLYMGNPNRKVLMRGLSALLPARNVERFWLALYGIDHSTPGQRQRFLNRVRQRVGAIRPG